MSDVDYDDDNGLSYQTAKTINGQSENNELFFLTTQFRSNNNAGK